MVAPNPVLPCGGTACYGGNACTQCPDEMPPAYFVDGFTVESGGGYCTNCDKFSSGFVVAQSASQSCQYSGADGTPTGGGSCSESEMNWTLDFGNSTYIELRGSNIADSVHYRRARTTEDDCNAVHVLTLDDQLSSFYDCLDWPSEITVRPSDAQGNVAPFCNDYASASVDCTGKPSEVLLPRMLTFSVLDDQNCSPVDGSTFSMVYTESMTDRNGGASPFGAVRGWQVSGADWPGGTGQELWLWFTPTSDAPLGSGSSSFQMIIYDSSGNTVSGGSGLAFDCSEITLDPLSLPPAGVDGEVNSDSCGGEPTPNRIEAWITE